MFTAPGEGIPLPADTNPFATGWGLGATFAKDIGVSPDTPPFRHNVQDGVSLNLRYTLGFADLVNLASHDVMNRRELERYPIRGCGCVLPHPLEGRVRRAQAGVERERAAELDRRRLPVLPGPELGLAVGLP